MKNNILQKIETAATPDFGNLLSNSFNLFKKIWVDSLVHLLITMIAFLPFLVLIYLPFIPVLISSILGGSVVDFDPFMDYSILMILGYSILLFVIIIMLQGVSIAITAHFFQVCKNKDMETVSDTGGYFAFLKGNNFNKVFLLSLATFGISLAALLLCYFPIFYVMVPLQLIIVIFSFNDKLSVSEIIEISFKLGNKFWLLLFGLIIVSSIIAQLGVILCFVGLFITAYFVHIPIYYFYKETIGFKKVIESSNNEFFTHYDN